MDRICNVEIYLPSTPELVLDLLAAAGGGLSSQALCRAGAVMQRHENAMRVALTRLLAEAKILRSARGLYELNAPGLWLSEAVNAWQRQPGKELPWKGGWIAVHDASVGRADKTAWRHHQLALSLRGFAALQPGLHIRPDNRPGGIDAERQTLAALGLAPAALVFGLDQLDAQGEARARGLWRAERLKEGYERMSRALREHLAQWPKLHDDRIARESLLLGRAAVMHLVRDPMLPSELLPGAARDAFKSLTQQYKRRAGAHWQRWLSRP